jgi:hypothetical protein
MNETLLKKYVETIEFWKKNTTKYCSRGDYQEHHAIPKCFQKIKQECKNEITLQLEKHYAITEIVTVPNRIHFELHVLLAKMFPERSQEWFKMSYALAWFMGKSCDRRSTV